ncbi:sensor domain-containing phosphodiesterase [Arthrobacter bambusae]|uniref:PAS domain S-box-containing protein n=1 Tax=Arthrobacter bambusae TaxID=1338426 RepID=A0AAW8DM37_9MICC|nr:EAL domain-containing protein [Arthrobacter bambusae]MDP9906933.1 PAS domain S-box-containing protein [Arthrobacter bambusae]MDQ0131089.1 PAS domain S-box-containing protein [Arthrobacter bambusae]MDQ0182611.1 PAS domain S-box-containing protein [Arthrobacter bambusae]
MPFMRVPRLKRASSREGRQANRLASASTGWWLLVVVFIEAAVALSIRLPLAFGLPPWGGIDEKTGFPALLALLIVPLVVLAAWRLMRQQQRERSQAFRTSRLMDTVLHTSMDWLWATGPDGRFTFCSPACKDITGYEPSELLGRHITRVIDPGDLADARVDWKARESGDSSWSRVITVCRHRDGSRVLIDVAGRPIRDREGRDCGFEGTCRVLNSEATRSRAEVTVRIQALLNDGSLITAFQPIRCLETGNVVGVESLTRFSGSQELSPEVRFMEAASVGLDIELEILALRTALTTAAGLPPELYIAANLSPRACLDPRLAAAIEESAIPPRRIVLEVTERHEVANYEPLAEALAPLRRAGLRIAVDDAGAGFASMRHILQLKPDLIKLDREIIAGIDTDPAQRALGAAMVGFSSEIGAALVAEGIETEAELAAVTKLGMTAAQGYLLGRPSLRPEDWARWE